MSTHQLSDGAKAAVPGPVADAHPERTVQSRAARVGDQAPAAAPDPVAAGVVGPTCCRACREDRSGVVGPSRRWALTDKGYSALGQVNVRILSRAELEEIAEQNRALCGERGEEK